jgi:CHASE1-domain containing sensor protein
MLFGSGVLISIIVLALAIYFLTNRNGSQNLLEKDAARFARLLISEIKLYENYKVERGLKTGNLYDSLRDEIEEARKKFRKRIQGRDFEHYFDDALVDVLADGDKSKLGFRYNQTLK